MWPRSIKASICVYILRFINHSRSPNSMFTFLVASNYLWRGPRRDNVSRGHWSVQESIPKLSVGTMDIDSDLIAIQRSIGPQRRRPQIILIDLRRQRNLSCWACFSLSSWERSDFAFFPQPLARDVFRPFSGRQRPPSRRDQQRGFPAGSRF
jgi:hypothetical protein